MVLDVFDLELWLRFPEALFVFLDGFVDQWLHGFIIVRARIFLLLVLLLGLGLAVVKVVALGAEADRLESIYIIFAGAAILNLLVQALDFTEELLFAHLPLFDDLVLLQRVAMVLGHLQLALDKLFLVVLFEILNLAYLLLLVHLELVGELLDLLRVLGVIFFCGFLHFGHFNLFIAQVSLELRYAVLVDLVSLDDTEVDSLLVLELFGRLVELLHEQLLTLGPLSVHDVTLRRHALHLLFHLADSFFGVFEVFLGL